MAITALWEFGEGVQEAEGVLPLLHAQATEAAGGDGPAPGEGALAIVFAQLLHMGPEDDTIARFEDGAATLRLALSEDGALRVMLGAGDAARSLSTPDGFVGASDTIRAILAWQGGGARLVAQNLFTGEEHEVGLGLAPPMPARLDSEGHWALPGDGDASGFQGSLIAMGIYDDPADAGAIAAFGQDDDASAGQGVDASRDTDATADLIGGATLDLDSDAPQMEAALQIAGVAEGAEYVLSFRALDIAAEGDSFRILWNGEPLIHDGAEVFTPPSDDYGAYALRLTGGSGDGSNSLEFLGEGGEGGVAIALEDLRLTEATPADPDAAGGAGGAGPAADAGDDADMKPVTVTLEGGASGQANSLGAYVIDSQTGALLAPEILFGDTRDDLQGGPASPGDSAEYMAPEGAQIGLFLIGGGAHYNDLEALGPGRLVFLNEAGALAVEGDAEPQLWHLAADGTQTLLDGPVFHSAGHGARAGLNPDGTSHVSTLAANDDGTMLLGFDDSFGAGAPGDAAAPEQAADFGALRVSVDPRAAAATLVAPGASPEPDAAGLLADETDETDETDGADEADGADGADGADMVAGLASPGLLVLLPSARVMPEAPPEAANFPDEPEITAPAPEPEPEPAPDAALAAQDAVAAFPAAAAAPAQMSAQLSQSTIVPCFTPGTLIDTARGRVPVETLRPGDRVLSRDHGFQPIDWVGRKEVSPAELVEKPHMRGVRISAGALGGGLPERDMVVSPQHRVLVIGAEAELLFGEREVLVPAIHMLDIPGVVRDGADSIIYIHIMCSRHEILRSDGIWSESFQPGDLSLAGLDRAQRAELLELFPELVSRSGRSNYVAARRSLQRYETLALMAPRRPRRVGGRQGG